MSGVEGVEGKVKKKIMRSTENRRRPGRGRTGIRRKARIGRR